MPTTYVPINSSVLVWAIEESGLPRDELAERLGVAPEALESWVSGQALPSKGQFTKLVRALRRPSAIFLLPAPPEQAGLPPRFRTAPGRTSYQLTPDQLRHVRRARRLQRFLSSLRHESQLDLVSVPRYIEPSPDPEVAGETVRAWLDVSVNDQLTWDSDRSAFFEWRRAAERRRLLVMQLQLGSKVVRGFSSWDEYAPLIAINTAYNYAARTYTLFHELGHLVRRDDAACAISVGRKRTPRHKFERWCESFAAAALLPAAPFLDAVEASTVAGGPFELASSLAEAFGVSFRAVAIRMIGFDLADQSLYDEIEERASGFDREKGFAIGRPQDRVERRIAELGGSLRAFVDAFEAGRISERDMADLLRLDGTEVDRVVEWTQGAFEVGM